MRTAARSEEDLAHAVMLSLLPVLPGMLHQWCIKVGALLSVLALSMQTIEMDSAAQHSSLTFVCFVGDIEDAILKMSS
jgi:hypothetical protein